jgi:hypothetical protein
MATHYIENGSSGNQYYFDANSNSTSQTQKSAQDRTYASPISTTTSVGSSEFSPYPTGVAGVRSQHQQIRSERNTYHEDDSYQLPQQHQSVAGFSKTVSQQQYQAAPSSAPQVRATVRSVTSQEQQQQQQQAYVNYEQQTSSQPSQISPQQHQYDTRQQAGQPISPSGYYQAPGPAQYLPHELDQRTESPSRSRDPHAQAQQVSVRAVSNSAHHQQQQHSSSQVSPQQTQQPQQQNQDQLQQYYSQLTPEQYQQLLRQQQIQRQQQEEQKRQQLAQQQYYLQQQQERQRVEQQQQQQYQPSRSNQDSPIYDEYQQRRVPPNPPNQEQQYRQQGQDQYDAHQQRSQRVHGSVSPNVNQDPYRQQQHQGQQSQLDAYHEQQRRAAVQQSSSSSTYQQEQYRSTVGADGGQQYQQVSPNQQQQQGRTDSERQRQEEQEYYAAQLVLQQQQERAAQIEAAQRQQAAQRAQQQQLQQQQQQYQEQQQQQQQIIQSQQPAQPVGIRGLMNKFTGPTTIPTYEPKAKTITSQHHSSSSYTSSTGSGQTTTTRSSTIHAMTYSALPKPQEPPVNSAEYYQLMQGGNTSNTSSNIQQPTAPPHIQGPAPGFGALRDRFKSGSTSESTNPIQDIRRQQLSNTNNSGLSSLRDQYINRAKESTQIQEESFSQRIQHVSRSIVGGENQPQPKPQQQQTPPAPPSTPQVPQQQEDSPVQSQSVDDQAASSEGAVADGGSSSGASPLESDAPLAATAATPATSLN